MAGLIRHIGAALVAIAMIAAQIMPAWAGCHSQRHVAALSAAAVSAEMPGHHGMIEADKAATDAAPDQAPASQDACLGNCGCACGLGGAFVLTGVIAIDAPHGVARNPEFVSSALPLGDRPDGPRRPPRPTA